MAIDLELVAETDTDDTLLAKAQLCKATELATDLST